MRKILVACLILALAATAYAYYDRTHKETPATVTTAKVSRGNVVETIGATGTLQAVTTVQVGTQVSGTVQQLYADFNSLVHKGEVLARLDPSLIQAQIAQGQASLARAQADLERLRVASENAHTQYNRAKQLSEQNLIPQSDLDAAEVGARTADAQLRSQEAMVNQAKASLEQNQVDLAHTVIAAPIDGLVISRNVDVGQTVAASMQAPTLFVLAADLSKMQVLASMDESDVGRIRPHQAAKFRVDAYPNEEFTGTVTQVRLQPQTVQNVVTYNTVIDVANPDLKLKPGMTANLTVEVTRSDNVLRVPNSALRFRPTADVFQALGQPAPAAVTGAARGGNGGAGGRARTQNAEADGQAAAELQDRKSSATTIDALFAPIPKTESAGRAWTMVNGTLTAIPLKLGVSDGQQTEVVQGNLQEGQELVTAVVTSSQRAATNANSTAFPGFQPNRGGGFGGRGF